MRPILRGMALAALLLLLGCEPTEPSTPAALVMVSGDAQIGPAGEPLPAPLVVSVVNQAGKPVSGVQVTWTVTSGGGALSTLSSSTDSRGRSQVTWTIGARVGANAATATVAGLTPAAFSATAQPGPPARITPEQGEGQTALAATQVAQAVTVKITDRHGNPVPGTTVGWEVTQGGGRVDPAESATDADGLASARWTLGRYAGPNEVTGTPTAAAGVAQRFTALGTPNGTISGRIQATGGLLSLSLQNRRPETIRSLAPESGRRRNTGLTAPPALRAGGGRMGREERAVYGSRLVVTYRPAAVPDGRFGPSAAQVRAAGEEIRSRLEPRARTLGFRIEGVAPVIRAARIAVPAGREQAVTRELAADPAVATVTEELWLYRSGDPPLPAPEGRRRVPNDPLYGAQSWHYNLMDLGRAWRHTTGSRSVLVAVIDDGIRFDHPDIAANLTNDGYDFVSQVEGTLCGRRIDNAGDGDGYDPDPTIPAAYSCIGGTLYDATGHGLHVAGTIGAVGNDGYGLSGVNWAVRIRPIRALGVLGGGSSYDIAQAVLYAAGLPADDGKGGQVQAPSAARIINMSLGGEGEDPVLAAAIRAATAAGSLVIAAAGNQSNTIPQYPAAWEDVLAVSAVDPYAQPASYSNYGPWVDVSAPGGDYNTGGADFMIGSLGWDFAVSEPIWVYMQGTSMAAPHVAGVAALLLAAEPSLSPAQLSRRITEFATDLGPPGRDDRYGAGIVNARASLRATKAIPGRLHARAYDAITGAIVRSAAGSGNSYELRELEDRGYHVYAGVDEEDGLVGVPGGLWGAYADSSRLGLLTVDGAGTYPAHFTIGFPMESEPNDTPETAARLVVDGYTHGALQSASDVDVYAVTLPAGVYTFETSGWNEDACGYATAADTFLELLGEGGAVLRQNDHRAARDRCSSISESLPAGTYHLRVTRLGGGGFYRLAVRRGG